MIDISSIGTFSKCFNFNFDPPTSSHTRTGTSTISFKVVLIPYLFLNLASNSISKSQLVMNFSSNKKESSLLNILAPHCVSYTGSFKMRLAKVEKTLPKRWRDRFLETVLPNLLILLPMAIFLLSWLR